MAHWRAGAAALLAALLAIAILPTSVAKPSTSPVRPSEEDSPTWEAMKWATQQFVTGGLAEALAMGMTMPLSTMSIAAQNEGVLNQILRNPITLDHRGRPVRGQPAVPALLPPLKMAERLYWRFEQVMPAYSASYGVVVLLANALKATGMLDKLVPRKGYQLPFAYGLASALSSILIAPADFALRRPRSDGESSKTFLGAARYVALREAPLQAMLGATLASTGCHEGRCSFSGRMVGVLCGALLGACTSPADVMLSKYMRDDKVQQRGGQWNPPMPRASIRSMVLRALSTGLRAFVIPIAMRLVSRIVYGVKAKDKGPIMGFENRHVREAGKVTEQVASSEDVDDDEMVLFDLPWDDDHDVNLLEDTEKYNNKVKNKYVDPATVKAKGWRRRS